MAEAAGRVRGAARAVPAPAGSRVTRTAETRGGGGGGGWVREAGPLRIPRGRHWPTAGIVRRASPAATLRRSLRRGVPAEPGAAAAPLTRAGKVRAPRPSARRQRHPLARWLARRPTPNFFYLPFNWLLFLQMNDLSLLS